MACGPFALDRAALATREPGSVFDRFRALLSRVPDREKERLQRVADLADTALDHAHPPLAWRRLVLLAEPVPARVMSDEAERTAIDSELRRYEDGIGKRLVDELRWSRC
jgi:hypothetical protein